MLILVRGRPYAGDETSGMLSVTAHGTAYSIRHKGEKNLNDNAGWKEV